MPQEEVRMVIETPSDENCDNECGSCTKPRLKKLLITSAKWLVVVNIFAVGLFCGSMISSYNNRNNITTNQGDNNKINTRTNQGDHFEKPTEPKNSSAKERFHNKMDEFESVGCEPRPERIYTKSLLDPTDETIHVRIYPTFQYVNQCIPAMNCCPGTMECLPTEDGKKPYKLHFRTELHYEEKYAVNVMEHSRCKCQSVMTQEP